ncbi:MAG TPA: hypothetical protein VI408_02915 [Gaiellaceae bacterium]
MISAASFLAIELAAAGVLALWVVARFPRLGPRSLRPALFLVLVSLALFKVAAAAAPLVVSLPHGAWLLLFGCALPSFFGGFLAVGWLFRVCAGMLGGSGGGPGEPITARS